MSLLEKINEKEVLRYLGFKNKDADEFTAKTIEEMSSLVFEKAQIKYVYQKFELEKDEDFCLKNTVFNLQGEDIKKLLEECNFCVVMASTLGGEIDTEIRKMQIRDMAKAVILDACASSAIENVCDNLQKQIEEEFGGYHSTRRFSPGYGDMPLESQKMLCNVLQTHKNTGIAINSGGLMTPVKSVTAIIGFSDKKQKRDKANCENCSLNKECIYRKEGRSCDDN